MRHTMVCVTLTCIKEKKKRTRDYGYVTKVNKYGMQIYSPRQARCISDALCVCVCVILEVGVVQSVWWCVLW